MIEKGLLDWKGFEPTNPASTIVGRGDSDLRLLPILVLLIILRTEALTWQGQPVVLRY